MDSNDLLNQLSDRTLIGFYLIYATTALGIVVWLARTLFNNGQLFLRDVFDNEELGLSVNRLLVIGFYLLNLGYALLIYRLDSSYRGLVEAFSDLIRHLALLLLSLGVIYLFNMLIFWRIRTHRDRHPMLVGPISYQPAMPNFTPPPPVQP
ncbi:MAG: hypothetical protein O3C27_07935 [Actinomycetota bacterium]|nr:hypothetical protein [Actinomycetota bacterium]